jgi:hypothetical protein
MPSIRKRYKNGNGTEAPALEPTSPVEQATNDAIEEKLDEQATVSPLKQQIDALEKAQRLAAEPPPQVPQMQMPDAVRSWLEKHPDYLSDPVLQAEMALAHAKTWRDGIKDWGAPEYVPTIEKYLGIAAPLPVATPERAVLDEAPAPAPQAPRPAYQGPPVSAPISRAVPSMTTGRPTNLNVQLTAEQAAFARSQGLSEEEYKRQLVRMERMKRTGAIQ